MNPVGDQKRADAEAAFNRVLQELRVVQTGVQILSGFLLTLPFTFRFATITTSEKTIFVVILVAAAVTTALVIAPVSYHRRTKGSVDLAGVARISARFAQAGMVTLLISAVCSTLLTLQVAVGQAWAIPITAFLTVTYVGLWYGLPALHRRRASAAGEDRSQRR